MLKNNHDQHKNKTLKAKATHNFDERKRSHCIDKLTFSHLKINMDDEKVWKRFNKAYVEAMESPEMTYIIQDIFNIEGYFAIRVTPLGENIYLLEAIEEGELTELVETGRD